DTKPSGAPTGLRGNTTLPTSSTNDVIRADGNSATISFDFTVSLSAAPGQTVRVNYATADGTATTADNDYVATSGTLTFGPDETSKSISVTVNGDTKFESDGAEFRSGPSMVEASASDSGATRRSHSLSTKATRYSGPNNSDLRIRSRVTAASCPPWETAGKIRS